MTTASLLVVRPKAFIYTLFLVESVDWIASQADVRSDTVLTGKLEITQRYICSSRREDGWVVHMSEQKKTEV